MEENQHDQTSTRLELAQHFAATHGSNSTPDVSVNIVAHKAHSTITQNSLNSTHVITASGQMSSIKTNRSNAVATP